MIDFSKLEKIAEYRNGELQWLEDRDINAVYVILVGGEYYIGSSHYTYLRIGQHLGELKHGHHHSQKLQDKFNEIGEFEVYSLDRGIEKAKLKAVEFQYIKKYRPSLNVIVPKEEERNQKELSARAQLAETYELLPISYIAKEYFGKTAAWLYQRLNGYKVRGKVYSLTNEEKNVFNRAVQDIAHRIGSVSIV